MRQLVVGRDLGPWLFKDAQVTYEDALFKPVDGWAWLKACCEICCDAIQA